MDPSSSAPSSAAFAVVALDGPSGVGKSTTARALAERLGFFFLSSGLIYRALAWCALERGWRPGAPLPAGLLDDVRIEMRPDGGLTVNGADPGAALRGEAVTYATSLLSAQPEARTLSNRVQRETVAGLARSGHCHGVILEGRDIGTVVFPDAPHKFFVTASTTERARRRHAELVATDPAVSLEAVAEALEARDARDATRDVAPLKAATDALCVDTTALTLEQVVDRLEALVRAG